MGNETENQILERVKALETKVEAVYRSSERMRKYFLWTLIITGVLFVLPLIGLIFAIPFYLNSINQALNF